LAFCTLSGRIKGASGVSVKNGTRKDHIKSDF